MPKTLMRQKLKTLAESHERNKQKPCHVFEQIVLTSLTCLLPQISLYRQSNPKEQIPEL